MADEIQKNHQPTQKLTAEPKSLDLDTVKCFVEKMKNDVSQKADKLQIELMQASYISGRLAFLKLLGITALQ